MPRIATPANTSRTAMKKSAANKPVARKTIVGKTATKPAKRIKVDPVAVELVRNSLTAATEDRDRTRRHIRAVSRSLSIVNAPALRPDNLMLIKGVKTVLNSQLHAYGIFTYRQIAARDEDDMHAFSELLSFKQRISRDKWQDQARQLHEARYGERVP